MTVLLSDKVPEDKDVKAGWTALIVFIALALAVVVLAFSLVKQLRKAQAAKDSGVYGDEPVDHSAGNGAGNGADNGADDQR